MGEQMSEELKRISVEKTESGYAVVFNTPHSRFVIQDELTFEEATESARVKTNFVEHMRYMAEFESPSSPK
jgi:hypothetical protein